MILFQVCKEESCRNVGIDKKTVDSFESSALVAKNIALKAPNQYNKT